MLNTLRRGLLFVLNTVCPRQSAAPEQFGNKAGASSRLGLGVAEVVRLRNSRILTSPSSVTNHLPVAQGGDPVVRETKYPKRNGRNWFGQKISSTGSRNEMRRVRLPQNLGLKGH